MEPTSNLKQVTLFIHGVCTADKVGPGGWVCRLVCDGVVAEMFGCNPQTTVNRMALRAAIEGLTALKHRCRVNVRTGSDYVCKGMTWWLPRWKTNGWQTETGEVKNQELWKELGDAARSTSCAGLCSKPTTRISPGFKPARPWRPTPPPGRSPHH